MTSSYKSIPLIDAGPRDLGSFNEFGIRRRDFLKFCAWAPLMLHPGALLSNDETVPFPEEVRKFVREARYYEKLAHKKIRCKLCPRECVIDDRERGYCGVRENRGGIYYTLVYSRPCSLNADPIEKKPLFHFLPGSLAFSLATAGCNLNCKFCQNWEISQVRPDELRSIYLPPEKTVSVAKSSECRSIAYTYSEPTIFFEYMEDIALAAKPQDIRSVVVTAAYISKEPLDRLCRIVDAIKVDLKSFYQKYYTEIVRGEVKPVLDSLISMRKNGVWTEIVYLVVPTLNDSTTEFTDLCRWIKTYLGTDIPLHFTRFHPQYLLKNLPPTPVKTLERAVEIARAEGLNYVYIGNVPGHPAENTYCPHCGKKIIGRSGYFIREIHIKDSCCVYCEQNIAGIWQD